MKRKNLLYLLLFVGLTGYSQDTVRIRNIKEFKQGKVNMLVSPSGKLVEVKLLDRSDDWQEEDQQEIESDGFRSPASGMNKMVDPNLTPQQKKRRSLHRICAVGSISENACRNARFAGLSRSKVKTSITQNQPRTYTSLPKFMNSLFPDKDMTVVVRALSKPYAV